MPCRIFARGGNLGSARHDTKFDDKPGRLSGSTKNTMQIFIKTSAGDSVAHACLPYAGQGRDNVPVKCENQLQCDRIVIYYRDARVISALSRRVAKEEDEDQY